MNPKEKAMEIYNKVNDLIPITASFNDTAENANEQILKDAKATKELSIYFVDSIYYLNYLEEGKYIPYGSASIKYWQEVKNHLNQM
jgi:hypothetical protein